MANTFPADLFADSAVASMSGLGGAFSGLCTILSTYVVGYLADHYGFRPVVVGASVVPLFAMGLVLLLVRNTKYSGQGIILKI
jgi:sugar phosphate permease